MFVAAPVLAPLIAPGFDAADLPRLVDLTRILLLGPIFLALSAVATSVLNSAGRFAASVMAPIVYNVVIIAAAVTLVPTFGLAGLAWGTVAGAAATLLVQVAPVFRGVGFRYTPALDLRDREARRTLVLLGPRAIGLAGSQLTLLLLTTLGSTLAAGAIGAFALAFTIFQIPLGTIAYPLGIVALPALSQRVAAGAIDEYVALVTRALRLLGFAMLPLACIAAGVAVQVVDLVIDFGRVDDAGIALTGAAFAGSLPRSRRRPSSSSSRAPSLPPATRGSRWAPRWSRSWSPWARRRCSWGGSGSWAWPSGSRSLPGWRRRSSWLPSARATPGSACCGSAGPTSGTSRPRSPPGLASDRAYDLVGGSLGSDPGSRRRPLALGGAGLVGLAVYAGLAAVLRVPELGATVRLVRSGLGRSAA